MLISHRGWAGTLRVACRECPSMGAIPIHINHHMDSAGGFTAEAFPATNPPYLSMLGTSTTLPAPVVGLTFSLLPSQTLLRRLCFDRCVFIYCLSKRQACWSVPLCICIFMYVFICPEDLVTRLTSRSFDRSL